MATGAAVVPFVYGSVAHAQDYTCPATGVYLVTTDDGAGPQITFKFDLTGTATATFSNQGVIGSPTAAATTSDQGVYKCKGNRVTFRLIDFNLASATEPASINRVDGTFNYDPQTKSIAGGFELRQFPLYSDPFGDGGQLVIRRSFTGVRFKLK